MFGSTTRAVTCRQPCTPNQDYKMAMQLHVMDVSFMATHLMQMCVVQLKDLDFPKTSPSFRQYYMEQIAADIKETIGRVSDGPFDAEQNASIPTVNYEVITPCIIIEGIPAKQEHGE